MSKIVKKSLGQNFLKDKNISNKILKQTKIKGKIILEIGPGYGFLTDFIIKENPNRLILVEKDERLYSYLKNKYISYKNIEIYNEDIMKFNFKKYKNINIIGNLPYNISSKIILKLNFIISSL